MQVFSTILRAAAGFALGFAAQSALAQGAGSPPPPKVEVETVSARDLPVTYEYPGRIAASREVEVRARVGGILLTREFEEGSRVAEGDLLFTIDPARYQADVALARAKVVQAQAQLTQAQRTEERSRALAQRGASSQAALDDALSARELAEAQVEAAEAELRTAELSLDYATVEAPVGGITSLEQVPEGSLLNTGDLLTKISQLDPVYVNFSAADKEAASIRELVENGTLQGAASPEDLTVEIIFGSGETYGETGKVDFTSTSIDTQTGTILSRAVMPNPASRLLPGQFVRLKLTGLSIEDAITIPAEALMQGPQGMFVYTLDDKNVAAVAPITVQRQVEAGYVVGSGLKAGDRIVTKGVIKVRPGSPVDPTGAEEPSETPAGEASGQAPAADAGAEAPAAPAAEADTPPAKERGSADKAADAGEPRQVAQMEKGAGGPPVPRAALPDGEDARRATASGADEANR
ncbi:MAG: efflux RND transporter periplasmic adaptor subunit [Fulvimarina manganoxydans]|nr:efflux RND transporter periplasmic adaptor subunit [Fulvimarina manganoxydans]MCK5930598.1 efflux RND transporter periplasmic adaptor subunit [Fulvimarina manganoxydans]